MQRPAATVALGRHFHFRHQLLLLLWPLASRLGPCQPSYHLVLAACTEQRLASRLRAFSARAWLLVPRAPSCYSGQVVIASLHLPFGAENGQTDLQNRAGCKACDAAS